MRRFNIFLFTLALMITCFFKVSALTVSQGTNKYQIGDNNEYNIIEKKDENGNLLYCVDSADMSSFPGSDYIEDASSFTQEQLITIGNIISSNEDYPTKETAIYTFLGANGETKNPQSKGYILYENAKKSANEYKNAGAKLSSTTLSFRKEGNFYVSEAIRLSSDLELSDNISYDVKSSDNRVTPTVSTGDNGKTFVVKINANQLQGLKEKVTITLKVNARISSPYAKIYRYTGEGTYQKLAQPSTTSKLIELNASTTIGSTKLVINKTDENSNNLSGSKIKIECISDNCSFEETTITTTDEDYVFDGIPYGKYKITEIEAPDGYVINKASKEVEISLTNLYSEVKIENKPTKVEISKLSSENGKLLSGAVLQVEDKEGNIVSYCTDNKDSDKACKWESTDEKKYITGLPHGTYYLKEVSAPEGYELIEDRIEFVVDDETSIIRLEIENALEVKVPDTLSSKSLLLIAISMFDIALGIGIIAYVKKNKIEE